MINHDWSNTLFSDECSVEKGKGKKVVWAFGYPSEKWTKERIETYNKGKQASVMIWGAIGGSAERSELIIMRRDDDSLHGGYSAVSYCQTLEDGLLPIYNGEAFVQDNALIHNATRTTAFLAGHTIWLVANWPPYSPDLNCIEHIWWHLKQMVYELLPGLDDIQGYEQQRQALIDILPEAWRRIRSDIVRNVIDSMPRRLQAVIDAQGWHTKY